METDIKLAGRYTFYVGTARGVIGSTQCKPGEKPHYQFDGCTKTSEITTMSWGRNNDLEIIYGNTNGLVKSYDLAGANMVDLLEPIGEGPVVGLDCKSHQDGLFTMVAARKSGHVTVCLNHIEEKSTFKATTDNDNCTLDKLRLNYNRCNVVATGGEFNGLKVWDLERGVPLFQAKSMGHDNLNLPIPTSIRDVGFFTSDPPLTCCCTREGYVLVYDERAQRRPICKFIEPKASYTCLATIPGSDQKCLVGTTKGYVQLLDMRKPSRPSMTYGSYVGGVTAIVCDPHLSTVMATTSVDRHLRIHHVETKELLHKEYMKLSLTQLMMRPVIKVEKDDDEEVLGCNVDSSENNNNARKRRKRMPSEEVENYNDDEDYNAMLETMPVLLDDIRKRNKQLAKMAKKLREKRLAEEATKNINKSEKTNNDKNLSNKDKSNKTKGQLKL